MLGFSTLINSAKLDASGYITGPGGTSTGTFSSESKDLVAPIPAIGASGRYTLLPRFMIVARVKGLPKVTISGYSGKMIDFKAGLDYYFTRNIGIGAAYSYTKISFAKEGSTSLQFDYTYSGPYGYLKVAF